MAAGMPSRSTHPLLAEPNLSKLSRRILWSTGVECLSGPENPCLMSGELMKLRTFFDGDDLASLVLQSKQVGEW